MLVASVIPALTARWAQLQEGRPWLHQALGMGRPDPDEVTLTHPPLVPEWPGPGQGSL